MDPISKDERFAHIPTDLRFRSVPRGERKIKIDERFRQMFTGDLFKLKYSVDKRGRPQKYSTEENLKKYYELSSSEDEEESEDTQSDEQEELPAKDKIRKNTSVRKESKLKVAVESNTSEDDSESDSDDDDSREHVMDLARGEGNVETSSSSDDSSSESELEELIHPWNELHNDAPQAKELSNRLAICNMDWERINAKDLFALLSSFTPPGGILKSIKVYVSKYGRERLKEEELKGPAELRESTGNYKKNNDSDEDEEKGDDEEEEDEDERDEDEEDDDEDEEDDDDDEGDEDEEDDDDDDEGDEYQMEKLRQYQLNKLKYYYAVAECDSIRTASKIYKECDGMQYENSGGTFDLRFVPPDVTFDQVPHSIATSDMDLSNYRPKYFITSALQQSTVKSTWEETSPERTTVFKKVFENDDLHEDVRAYLASASSDDESDKEAASRNHGFGKKKEKTTNSDGGLESDESEDNDDGISKYRALLQEIEDKESKLTKDDVHLEITWDTGLKEKTESVIQDKLLNKEMSPWEEYLLKRKLKNKQKRKEKNTNNANAVKESDNLYSDDELPSDVDINDPYFNEASLDEKDNSNKNFTKNVKQNRHGKTTKRINGKIELEETEEVTKQKAELELLVMEEGISNKRHFSLKKLLKEKKINKELAAQQDDFKIDIKDPRFAAVFNSHVYHIDPTDSNFKKTKGMEAFIEEKQRRQNEQEDPIAKKQKLDESVTQVIEKPDSAKDPSKTKALELALLVKSVKSKASVAKRNSK